MCFIARTNGQENTGQMIIIVFWNIKEETKKTKRQRYVEYLNIGGNQLWGRRRNDM